MRSGMVRLLAKVKEVLGASPPYHAYVFANRRGTRLKGLMCECVLGGRLRRFDRILEFAPVPRALALQQSRPRMMAVELSV